MVILKEHHDLIKGLWKSRVRKVLVLQKTTGFPKKTLYRWAKQLREINNLKQRSYLGYPKLLTPNKRHYFSHVAKSQRFASNTELTETLQKTYSVLNITPRTVRENLQK